MATDYSIVFVCQQGELEVKAALLAASLRNQLGDRQELIAGTPVPQQQWGGLARATTAFMERLGVRLAAIHNRIDVEYGHANKIPALGVEAGSRSLLFLDSDILCLWMPELIKVHRERFGRRILYPSTERMRGSFYYSSARL